MQAAGTGHGAGMTSRLANIAVDALDPERVAAFWCAVLDWQVLERDEGVVSLGPAGGSVGCPGIDVVPVLETKALKNRLHVDLRADGVSRDAELARLLTLGARRVDVGQDPDVSWVVLADPEGNEFCLLSRTVQEV